MQARAADAPESQPAQPAKTYALVAAFPDSFSVVYEVPARERTNVLVGRFHRSTLEAPAGTFNRVALAGLDKAITRQDPQGKRVFLTVAAATPRQVSAAQREAYLTRRVLAELEKMPNRREWHRIVVAVPHYRPLDIDRLPDKLEGFGVFLQPNCESDPVSCSLAHRPSGGPDVLTPDGRTARASYFVAPFSFITLLVLDPATLAVLDRERIVDHQKLFDPTSDSLDLGRNIDKEALAAQVVGVIERSVERAVAQTELAGKVEIREIREVTPGKAAR